MIRRQFVWREMRLLDRPKFRMQGAAILSQLVEFCGEVCEAVLTVQNRCELYDRALRGTDTQWIVD